jgi:hypothetical protein
MIIFSVILENTDTFVPLLYEFKNSITVETGLLTSNKTLMDHFTPQTKQVGIQFGLLKQHWKETGSTIIRKWKALFMNGYKCKNCTSTMMEILNLHWDKISASVCSTFLMGINNPQLK